MERMSGTAKTSMGEAVLRSASGKTRWKTERMASNLWAAMRASFSVVLLTTRKWGVRICSQLSVWAAALETRAAAHKIGRSLRDIRGALYTYTAGDGTSKGTFVRATG